MRHCLAVDLGRTSCRAALFAGSERLDQVELPSIGTASDRNGAEAVVRTLRAAATALTRGRAAVDVACAGVAGWNSAQETGLATRLGHALGVAEVILTNDIVTAHAGALDGRAGVVVSAGTGSAALGVTTSGIAAWSDGWGYLLGDDGSGYAIGRAGLRSALREAERGDGSARLLAMAEERFGDADVLPGEVQRATDPARAVSAFAVDVATAARAGDIAAQQIWEEAGRALAVTAAAAARRIIEPDEVLEISYTGGLFRAADLLLEPFESHLAALLPAGRLLPPRGDALGGARLLAADETQARYERLLGTRAGRSTAGARTGGLS